MSRFAMENGATSAAQRIEQAIARIDAALSRPRSPSTNQRELAQLSTRHDALRTELQHAIADLDALIGAQN